MLVDQAVHRGKRVAMQTVKELTRGFSFSQAKLASLILGQRNLTELLQQIGLAFGQEEDLVLSKVPQFAGGLAPTDAALVTAKPSKQGLQLQVIWWQARDIIARQQIRTTGLPHPVSGMIEGCLSRTALEVRPELLEQFFHLLFHCLTGQ
jgi:hypothetical protein